MMKNILVFTSTFPRFTTWDTTPGFVYELSKRLVQNSSKICILTPRVPWTPWYEERDGMKIYRYPYFFTSKIEKLNDGAIMPNLKANKWLYFQVPFLLLFWFIYLAKIIKKEKINIVHTHWIIPQWLITVIYKKIYHSKIKIIGTSHGSDIFWLQWKIGTYLKRFTLKNIDTLTVVSNAIKKDALLLGMNADTISILPMWTDTVYFSPKKYDENIKKKYTIEGPFLLFVWRLAEVKWIQYLIKAIPRIIDKYPKTKLLIIWDWTLEKELKNLSSSLWINNSIIFTGGISHEELPKYFATADIFIWPSIHTDDGAREWFGLTFVEAILSWCKTIWTNIAGITDIIEEWKTGFLIKEKNTKAIEETILELIANTDFDTENARKILENKFSWDIISKKYMEIINYLYIWK